MKQDNNGTFKVIQAQSLRSIIDQANSLNLSKDNFVQVIRHDDGFFLLYYK